MKTMFINTGVGAVYTALSTALAPFSRSVETTVFSEKDDVASMMFSISTKIPISNNIKNLKFIDGKAFKNLDLIVHGTEYQNGEGIDDVNETLRIVSEAMPQAIVWTTDVSITKVNNKEALTNYISALASLGYKSNYRVINAAQYGSAHHFTQLYIISTFGEGFFEFPSPFSIGENKTLPEYLQENPSTMFDIDYKHFALVMDEDVSHKYIIVRDEGKSNGEALAIPGDGIRWHLPTAKQKRRVKQKAVPHLTPEPRHGVYWNSRYRFLTPEEYFQLQEFPAQLIDSIFSIGVSNEKMYELATAKTVNILPSTVILYKLLNNILS